MEGFKFRRQQPIGDYVVDFVCFAKHIVVEADGGQHSLQNDIKRDEWLKKQGFKVLGFWNNDILKNVSGVLKIIRKNCMESPSP